MVRLDNTQENTVDMLRKLSAFLGDHKAYDIKPCIVRIGKEAWVAAHYKSDALVPENSRAWAEGQRTYTFEIIACLSDHPPRMYRRSGGKVCYTRVDDIHEWYVGVYSPYPIKPEFQEFHPLGGMFLLMPWTIAGNSVDYGQSKPYMRMTMGVEYVQL